LFARHDLVAQLRDGQQREGDGGRAGRHPSAPVPPSMAATRCSKTSVVGFMMRV
jgi:hypothetical protein